MFVEQALALPGSAKIAFNRLDKSNIGQMFTFHAYIYIFFFFCEKQMLVYILWGEGWVKANQDFSNT